VVYSQNFPVAVATRRCRIQDFLAGILRSLVTSYEACGGVGGYVANEQGNLSMRSTKILRGRWLNQRCAGRAQAPNALKSGR
jgi:hypothetical protein